LTIDDLRAKAVENIGGPGAESVVDSLSDWLAGGNSTTPLTALNSRMLREQLILTC